jgi:hypothetical protein
MKTENKICLVTLSFVLRFFLDNDWNGWNYLNDQRDLTQRVRGVSIPRSFN